MNKLFFAIAIVFHILFSLQVIAQTSSSQTGVQNAQTQHLFIDVHQLSPGKVKFDDVAQAHAKDLTAEKKYGVDFKKFWVDEKAGLVYCLSSAADTASILKTHADAHGLLPKHIYQVTEGLESNLKNGKLLFLDVHELGMDKVTAQDVAEAHKKDLLTQHKYDVNFINYWVDEKAGVVLCLSQAKDSTSIINTHKEAHGLLPAYVLKVKQGE